MRRRNVFIVGYDDFHRPLLEALPLAETCRLHRLLAQEELRDPRSIRFERLLDRARAQLDAFEEPVDAICTYWDFPASCLAPILARERGLPTAPLEAVVRCEHKYWSRVEQQAIIPKHVPEFCSVNPFAPDPAAEISIPYPFWLKPVKSFNSYLGFRVGDRAELDHAIAAIRAGIAYLAEPFDFVLDQVELPDRIRPIDGSHCIAEAIISKGRQCTVEGYGFGGSIEVFGTVDSHRFPGRSSFARYEYPSTLPDEVQKEMERVAQAVMGRIGYDGGAFNIEFYWDEDEEALWLLEINSRVSQSHSELFWQVDGQANHAVTLALALGEAPRFPRRPDAAPMAAKFFLRSFADGVVTSAPSADALARIAEEIPGVRVKLMCRPAQRLSESAHQDSYSYELAWIYAAGGSERELLEKYERAVDRLELRVDGRPVDPFGPS